ncbi:MAG: hypothetical protein FWD76_04370 [Firmicutes bacterium]|nr:hypothetical protein [Bacillota bacterium]
MNTMGLLGVATSTIIGAFLTVVLSAGVVFLVLLAVVMLVRSLQSKEASQVSTKEQEGTVKENALGMNPATALCFIVLLGAVARLLFGMFIKGDSIFFARVVYDAKGMANGVSYYPGGKQFPLAYYIFGFFGGILTGGSEGIATQVALKLPLILADIGTTILLYKIGKKYENAKVGLILALLYSFNPLFVWSTAMASSVVALVIFVLFFAFYMLVSRKYMAFVALYFCAILLDRSALLFAAPVAMYLLYLFFKGIKLCKTKGFEDIMNDPGRAVVIYLPLCVLGGFFASMLITLPLMPAGQREVFGVFGQVWEASIKGNGYFGQNALNIFNLFLRNGVPFGDAFPSTGVFVVFFLLAFGIAIILYLSKKNRANFVLIATFVALTVALYYIDNNAFTALPAIALLLLCYVLIKDKRLLVCFGLFCLVFFVNGIASQIHSDSFSKTTGNGLLDYQVEGGALVLSILCTIVALVVHIYLVVVTLDICMSNRVKELTKDSTATAGQCLKSLFSNK